MPHCLHFTFQLVNQGFSSQAVVKWACQIFTFQFCLGSTESESLAVDQGIVGSGLFINTYWWDSLGHFYTCIQYALTISSNPHSSPWHVSQSLVITNILSGQLFKMREHVVLAFYSLFNIIPSISIHANGRILYKYCIAYRSMPYIEKYISYFICLSVDKQVGLICILTITNGVTINMSVQVSH